MQVQKKKRGENWSPEEKEILRKLIANSANVIEDRSTKSNINSLKIKVWRDITNKCCTVGTVYGYSLRHGVVFVGIATTLISVITITTSATCLVEITGTDSYNTHPVVAVNLLFALFSLCISSYQIVISLLLIYQAFQKKGNMFLCWLWYVSHISILLFCCMFFSAKTIICFSQKESVMAIATLIAGVIYEGLFIYFSVIVNSFINIVEDDVYY